MSFLKINDVLENSLVNSENILNDHSERKCKNEEYMKSRKIFQATLYCTGII